MAQRLPVAQITGNSKGKLNLESPGFVECTVDSQYCDRLASQYPVLPYRKDGKLLFPLGRFRGVWSTVELRMAYEHGYSIADVGDTVYFSCKAVFEKYVKSLYELRDKSRSDYDETLSRIAKLLLNATYGKFGTNRQREKLWVRPSLHDIIEKKMMPLQGPLTLPVFVEQVQCEASYILPHLAAWITALGRIRLLRYIYSCKLPVYYTDTDSLFTCDTLETSTELGGLKEEYNGITQARFALPKVYRLQRVNGDVTSRVKGFSTFGRGFVGEVEALQRGESVTCSAFSKMRTVFRGDFGLITRQKRLRGEDEKRIFAEDGSSVPITVREA